MLRGVFDAALREVVAVRIADGFVRRKGVERIGDVVYGRGCDFQVMPAGQAKGTFGRFGGLRRVGDLIAVFIECDGFEIALCVTDLEAVAIGWIGPKRCDARHQVHKEGEGREVSHYGAGAVVHVLFLGAGGRDVKCLSL